MEEGSGYAAAFRSQDRGSVAQIGRAPGSYPGRCRFDACRGHSHRSGVVESVRRAAVNREAQVRSLPLELVPRARAAGALVGHLAVGELATPPASGAGDRRFDSCQPDSSRRRRSRKGRDMKEGSGSAAAFRSHARRRRSRKGRDIVYRTRPWGRSSDEQSARLSGERPPVRVRSSPSRVTVRRRQSRHEKYPPVVTVV